MKGLGGRAPRPRGYEAPAAAAPREHENAVDAPGGVEPPPTLQAELTPGAAAADIVAAAARPPGAALALAIVGALLRAAAEATALILPKYCDFRRGKGRVEGA